MKVLKWLEKNFERVILMVLLAIFSSVMMLQIIARFVFRSPFNWAEEFCRYAFVVSVSFASAYCIKNDVMLRVDAIINLFSKTIRRICDYFMWIVITATYGFLAYRGFAVLESAIAGKQTSAAMQIPMWWLYLAMECGLWLTTIRAIQAFIKEIVKSANEKETIKQ